MWDSITAPSHHHHHHRKGFVAKHLSKPFVSKSSAQYSVEIGSSSNLWAEHFLSFVADPHDNLPLAPRHLIVNWINPSGRTGDRSRLGGDFLFLHSRHNSPRHAHAMTPSSCFTTLVTMKLLSSWR
eukprot:931019-Rhodomonas_salina.1